MIKIYVLEKNNIPFYIGKAKNIIRRKHSHTRTYGLDIQLYVIDEVKDWKYWECYWIEQFKQWGFKLENKNNGGGGPSSYTEEQKQKMRKPRKEGTGDKISKTLKERNHSKYYTEEVRQKMSDALKDKPNPFTEEHIKNLTESIQKNAKPVYQFNFQRDLIKVWISKGEAANFLKKELNLTSNVVSQIKDCILGRQKTAFGYIWSYENITPQYIFNPIYQFDLSKNLINIFNSFKELKLWLKENGGELAGIDTIATSIKRESEKRIYKSSNNFYSINKTI
jgi:hypothetical protein